MIEQKLPEAIEFENLKNLKVRGKPDTIIRLYKFFNRIGSKVGFTYSDLTVSLGISNPSDFPIERVKAYHVFMTMPDGIEKDKFKAENKINDEFIKAYQEDKKARDERLKDLPVKISEYLLNEGTEEDLTEVYEIVQKATGYDLKVVKETDYFILSEILIRIVIKPDSAVQQAFFLNLCLSLLRKFMALLNIT